MQPYTDGDEPHGFVEIKQAFENRWRENYSAFADLKFLAPLNLKTASNRPDLSANLAYIERIRNPDLYLREMAVGIDIGGIEITDHSPDGSNIEKRYPFIWASRRVKQNAFTVSRYLKQRPGGQINRMPYRHAYRNSQFLREFLTNDEPGYVCQFVPVRELHMEDLALVPLPIRKLLVTWSELGDFFCHYLAARCLPQRQKVLARRKLAPFKVKLEALARACMDNATHETEASTLIKLPHKWIQVYNTRPDSGHWERGEGQFDSIDGRVMFTLDEIELLPSSQRPPVFEFWVPQMVSTHAWIAEQRERDFRSKRLRNLLVELAPLCTTRFADQLTGDDWIFLGANPGLLLERLDWAPEIYHVADLVASDRRLKVARSGLSHRPQYLLQEIERMLHDDSLYFSAHRAYIPGWRGDLLTHLARLPASATILMPRIPAALILPFLGGIQCSVTPAEGCTKEQLHLLRQLHRDRQ